MTAAGEAASPPPLARPIRALRWRTGVLVFLLWLGACAAWSLATPIWASPDEFQHAFRAYSAVHGQVYVTPVSAVRGTGGFVTVPRGWLESVQHYRCNFDRGRDATCLAPLTNDSHPVRVASTAARYNPLYYLVVGSVSLVSSPAHSVRLMRLVSAALSALFLAWAFTGALTARRPVLAASVVLMAATPMALFIGSMINPNGLEIAAAMCAWVCGYQALVNPDPVAGRILLRRAAIALIAVVETRAISPLWTLIILAVLAVAVVGRSALSRYRRDLVGWGAVLVVAIALAGAWSLISRSSQLENNTVAKLSFANSWRTAWDGGISQLFWLRGTVGDFGWLDAPLAPNVTDTWLFVVAGLLLLALLIGTVRERCGLVILGGAVALLPIWFAAVNYNRYGAFWQPRYTMPISLGLVLLPGVALAQSKRRLLPDTAANLVAAALAAVGVTINIIGFVVALSRYTVGFGDAISLTGHWQPPLGGLAVTIIEGACLVALAAAAWPFQCDGLRETGAAHFGCDTPSASNRHSVINRERGDVAVVREFIAAGD